ncbi:hypothetical protein M406DRAFT_263652 [Cryphonectria parasitica EP155]|uniref:Cytoskeleton-associated protein n=1 Tax=Cryphonectria parasitica (strain ATCC 38755 / EP155) TaxID=660469 RepID=A0A9P5CLU8_CRYP1|nr:uncharacterized protein M406DRAFT_263652 [Cryphonectria parasitica EP155]KAF3762411.1 hypothetical protein M406DRAFT_263652 [Cryphonectria parasitica EP155]
MSLLSLVRDDRAILLGLTAAAIGALAMIDMVLERVRDDAEVKQQQPTTQYITQETEDSLRSNTLDTLLSHYNYAIRDISSKIVTDRAVNDGETIDYLLWGITRPDYDERLKCLRTLAYITDPHTETVPKFNTPRAYAAFVRSLEFCLTDRAPLEKLDDKYFDEYGLRDMAEKLPLMFLSQLMQKYGSQQAVKAGIVEKWLARQNWGDTPDEREHNFFQYLYKQNRIVEIIHGIQRCPIGREALAEAGLMPKNVSETFGVFASIHIESEIIDNDQAEPTPRHMEQSPEEQRLRHRHREAMVLNDGTRPLGRSDIIEVEDNAPP